MKTYKDDEIDLVHLFQSLWEGRWKIVSVVGVSVMVVFGFLLTQPPPSFTATTVIKPITSVEVERYRVSNAIGFFEVNPALLQNLYIEQLEERLLFEEAIRKFELIDRKGFEDDQAFNEAVIDIASKIDVLPPINIDRKEKGEVRRYWSIAFEYNDDRKWKNALAFVDEIANGNVQRIVKQRFNTSLLVAALKRDFRLEDIATKIENVMRDFDKEMAEFELNQGFHHEDINTQIAGALADYDRKTETRLAFLREQAAIARKLGVSKNTIEAQTFSVQNGTFANVKTDTPFYLRGYDAIEKEIELIESREDVRPFVVGLLELDQRKRALEQDKTLQRAEKNKEFLDVLLALEKEQRVLEQDKTLERSETLFASTPVMNENDFFAVSLSIDV